MRNRPYRGFEYLLDETIVKVDAKCINAVYIECASGRIIRLNCDEQHVGIGIIQAEEQKK
jgi:hypothetical protein